MLLAQLHGKLKGRFACSVCGNEDAADFDALMTSEDALTSTVFSLLRYTSPRLALEPVISYCGISDVGQSSWHLKPWPRRPVSILRLKEATVRQVSCEPDMIIDGPTGVIVMEAKLGMQLGTDPMQLPQEALVAYRLSEGRVWRLLCVTAHRRTPEIGGFRAAGTVIESDVAMPLNEAVASYFEALRTLGTPGDWPEPKQVRENVLWASWGGLGGLFEKAAESELSAAENEIAIVRDVLQLLKSQALYEDPFRGFQSVPTHTLEARMPSLWTSCRRIDRFLWSYQSPHLEWPKLHWFAAELASKQQSLFDSVIAKPLTWPLQQWLAPTQH